MQKINYQHFYHRVETPEKGGITVAYLDPAGGSYLAAGVSFCSPHDTFNKKQGQNDAACRLCDEPLLLDLLYLGNKLLVKETVDHLLTYLLAGGQNSGVFCNPRNQPSWFAVIPRGTYPGSWDWR
jgi:hypothetical protein